MTGDVVNQYKQPCMESAPQRLAIFTQKTHIHTRLLAGEEGLEKVEECFAKVGHHIFTERRVIPYYLPSS